MKNTIKTIAKVFSVAVFAMSLVVSTIPTSASAAGKTSDYSPSGGIGGGSYYTSTPVSTYSYGSGGSSYYTSTPVSTYSYQPSYGGGSYIPAPAQRYVYNTPTGGGGGSSATAGQLTYVYSSNSNKNTNTNSNSNTNVISNTFNPTNNNDINIVVLGGGSGTNTNNQQNLDGYCVISPSVVRVNQDVTFSAHATGGSGSYTYQWSGADGINASSQSFTGRFSYAGVKSVTVVITSGSQSITKTCSVTVQQDTYYPPVTPVNAYCVATPANVTINQTVVWTAYINGSVYGATSFSWSGTDGLYGNSHTVSRAYSTPGYKTATFTAYVNGQTVTGTCAVNIGAVIGSNVTVIRDQNLGTPVSGVFLNQVPATGISFGLKMTLFSVGLVLWSIFAAYVLTRKSKNMAVANGVSAIGSVSESAVAGIMTKAQAFKLANMQKKGLAE